MSATDDGFSVSSKKPGVLTTPGFFVDYGKCFVSPDS